MPGDVKRVPVERIIAERRDLDNGFRASIEAYWIEDVGVLVVDREIRARSSVVLETPPPVTESVLERAVSRGQAYERARHLAAAWLDAAPQVLQLQAVAA